MTASAAESYWDRLSGGRRLQLLTQLIPLYVLHLTLRPYRKRLGEAPVPSVAARARARHAGAALDAWVHQLLGAYSKLTGLRLRKESGQLAILYIRIMAALNREYEYRLATGRALQLEHITTDPLVAARIEEWEQFAARYTRDPEVVKFLSYDDLTCDYDRYVTVTTRDGFSTNVELQLESIKLDSGGYLARLARLIGQFNGQRPEAIFLEEFRDLGTAAKFADELADLATDYTEGRYNLLLALLRHDPEECATAMLRLEHSLPVPVTWWLKCAPRTFERFSTMYEEHYRRVRSPELQRVCDATMLRALSGPKQHQSARSAQHVSEPPRDSWR